MTFPISMKNQAFITKLDSLLLIDITGIDAINYLHRLITNDVKNLEFHLAKLGALCNLNGRILVSFIYWNLNNKNTLPGIRLLFSSDLYKILLTTLHKYILRSKIYIYNASIDNIIYGVFGDQNVLNKDLFSNYGYNLPEIRLGRIDTKNSTILKLNKVIIDSNIQVRYLWIIPRYIKINTDLVNKLTPVNEYLWQWLEVISGESRIVYNTSGILLPQTINYDILQGIDFHKGCYPGQEVIARIQYRGKKTKSGISIVHVEQLNLKAGDSIFIKNNNQPIGTVILSAPSPKGGTDAIIKLPYNILNSNELLFTGPPHCNNINIVIPVISYINTS